MMSDEEHGVTEDVHTKGFSGIEGRPKSGGSWNWMMFGVVGLVVIVGAALLYPIVHRQIKRSNATFGVKHCKVIYVSAREYAFAHGGELMPAAANSNEAFRILFVEGYMADEADLRPRGAQNVQCARDGDNIVTGAKALEMGEFASTYWMRNDNKPANIETWSANTPFVSVPMLMTGKTISYYDGKYSDDFAGQAAVGRIDGSAICYGINSNGYLVDEEGERIKPMREGDDFSNMRPIYPEGCLPWTR